MAVNLDYRLYLGGNTQNTYNAYTTGASSKTTTNDDLNQDTNRVFDTEEIADGKVLIDTLLANGTFSTPQEAIDAVYGTSNPELAESLAWEYYEFDEETEASIAALQNTGISRQDAIGMVDRDMDTATYTPTSDKNEVPKSKYSDEKALELANSIYNAGANCGIFGWGWGTNEKKIKDIMLNENMSAADITLIAKQFNAEHGSLANYLDGELSGSDLKEITEAYALALIEQAKAGDEEAMKLICTELYNSTAGKSGTSDEFVAAIFENVDDELLKEIEEQYGIHNAGRSLKTDIINDFSGDTKEEYETRIELAA